MRYLILQRNGCDIMMIELLLACVCACLAGIAYRIWELNKTLKEIFVVQETAEELVRCKDCKYRGNIFPDHCDCIQESVDDNFYCALGKRK